jgi:prepilin-type processing-associated H-X9-DG protein
MPKIYTSPGADLKDKSLTYYKVFTGKNAMFDQGRKIGLTKISDLGGCSNTLMAIEAGDPVPWTKPDDIPFDPNKPLPKLAGPYKKVFNVLFADGHVITVPKDVSEKKLRAAIDINVGCGDLGGTDDSKGSKKPPEDRPRR